MNKELLKRIMVRNALCWAGAMVLPVTVMIVLDLFDLHTPERVGLFGGLSILVPFGFAQKYLGRELSGLIPESKGQA